MISKRKLEKFVNEEMAEVVKNTKGISDYAKTKGEYAKFFLLMRMSIKFNLFSKEVFRKLKEEIEKDVEEYGS